MESQLGQGTTFTVALPRSAERPDDAGGDDGRPFDLPLTILVIDDMEPLVEILRDAFVTSGQKVFTALSGRDAPDVLRRENIDVVVCDLGMAGMNGWEVGKAVKAQREGMGLPKAPFILITGWGGQRQEADRMAESSVDAVLEKPVDVGELLRVIRNVLPAREQQARITA